MEFIVSEKDTPNGIILVVTDKGLVGKIFEEGNKQLDLSKKFYQGELKNEEEVKKLCKDSYIIHLTGEKAVSLGKKIGLVKKIITIDNVPHAEVLL